MFIIIHGDKLGHAAKRWQPVIINSNDATLEDRSSVLVITDAK